MKNDSSSVTLFIAAIFQFLYLNHSFAYVKIFSENVNLNDLCNMEGCKLIKNNIS